ncbi:MAG: hypothetical protein AAGM22_31720, partial [Acidobacteriota bacterium]
GEVVTVFGDDFGTRPDDLMLWVRTADSGFALEVESADDQVLEAIPITVPKAETGALQLWKGFRHDLQDHTILTAGTLMTLHTGKLFIAREKVDGPLLSSIGTTPRAVGSKVTDGGLAIDITDPLPRDWSISVVVTVAIETGGGRPSENPPSTNSTAFAHKDAQVSHGVAWAASFTVDSGPLDDQSDLVAGLAELLNRQFESLGIEARAEGESLLITSPYGVEGGFLTLVY